MVLIHSTKLALYGAPTPSACSLRCSCPYPIAPAPCQGIFDNGQVNGVEDDDGVVLHPQSRGGVDPVTRPAGQA